METYELVDIGVNLTNRAFNKDREAVIARARAAGIGRQILTGTSEAGSSAALALAKTMPGVLFSTAGVHPHDAKSCTDTTIGHLRELAADDAVVAIGECGLDFNRDFSPRPVQERWFEAQVELAAELAMPLFLHERDAHERFVGILRGHRDRLIGAVVHCFTGSRAALHDYLDLGLHIGVTGWVCDERRGKELYELVKEIPSHRLMLETDAPYLLPRTIRPKPKGGRNEPAFLLEVLRTVAEARHADPADTARVTTETAAIFFGLERS